MPIGFLQVIRMFAIISDIHSNLEALTTVLADIEKRGIKTIYCLGDVVGYASNPKECLDLVIEKTEVSVFGNHDYAVLYEPTNFNLGAEQASYWTRKVLESEEDAEKCQRRWNYLGSQQMRRTVELKLGDVEAHIALVHASPRRPINEYLFPDDVYTTLGKINALFERTKHICFVGHTHLPVMFYLEMGDYMSRLSIPPINTVSKLTPRAIMNPGSVGQPRDRDPRASYVIFDTEANTWDYRRIEYDIEETQKRMEGLNLPERHVSRLEGGW